MAEAVLFDLDETLLDRTTSLRSFLRDQFFRFNEHLGRADYPIWEERFLKLDARGSQPKSKVYPVLLDEFGGKIAEANRLVADYAENCCKHAQPFEGMTRVLVQLRGTGKRLGIVTNGESAFQSRHLEALDLWRLVDEVLVSEEEGLRKPDPQLFLRGANRLGVPPEQCLFVGDNPRADILGAAAVGMQTAWFRCGQAWPDNLPRNPGATVDTLYEVVTLAG
ncbi:HAD family hydrolase [Caulobacter sp. LARHSG274]